MFSSISQGCGEDDPSITSSGYQVPPTKGAARGFKDGQPPAPNPQCGQGIGRELSSVKGQALLSCQTQMKGHTPSELLVPPNIGPCPRMGEGSQSLTEDSLESQVQLEKIISSFITLLTILYHLSHPALKDTSEN